MNQAKIDRLMRENKLYVSVLAHKDARIEELKKAIKKPVDVTETVKEMRSLGHQEWANLVESLAK